MNNFRQLTAFNPTTLGAALHARGLSPLIEALGFSALPGQDDGFVVLSTKGDFETPVYLVGHEGEAALRAEQPSLFRGACLRANHAGSTFLVVPIPALEGDARHLARDHARVSGKLGGAVFAASEHGGLWHCSASTEIQFRDSGTELTFGDWHVPSSELVQWRALQTSGVVSLRDLAAFSQLRQQLLGASHGAAQMMLRACGSLLRVPKGAHAPWRADALATGAVQVCRDGFRPSPGWELGLSTPVIEELLDLPPNSHKLGFADEVLYSARFVDGPQIGDDLLRVMRVGHGLQIDIAGMTLFEDRRVLHQALLVARDLSEVDWHPFDELTREDLEPMSYPRLGADAAQYLATWLLGAERALAQPLG